MTISCGLCVFCTVVVLTGFVKSGCVYLLVLLCASVLILCVLVFTVFYIVSFMYIYPYLFCPYQFKDYCHQVKTELQ